MGIDQIGGAEAADALCDDYAAGSRLAEKSVRWIEANKGGAFFLDLATTNRHHPFTSAKRFQRTSECGLYGDFVHEWDWIVGAGKSSHLAFWVGDWVLIAGRERWWWFWQPEAWQPRIRRPGGSGICLTSQQ